MNVSYEKIYRLLTSDIDYSTNNCSLCHLYDGGLIVTAMTTLGEKKNAITDEDRVKLSMDYCKRHFPELYHQLSRNIDKKNNKLLVNEVQSAVWVVAIEGREDTSLEVLRRAGRAFSKMYKAYGYHRLTTRPGERQELGWDEAEDGDGKKGGRKFRIVYEGGIKASDTILLNSGKRLRAAYIDDDIEAVVWKRRVIRTTETVTEIGYDSRDLEVPEQNKWLFSMSHEGKVGDSTTALKVFKNCMERYERAENVLRHKSVLMLIHFRCDVDIAIRCTLGSTRAPATDSEKKRCGEEFLKRSLWPWAKYQDRTGKFDQRTKDLIDGKNHSRNCKLSCELIA